MKNLFGIGGHSPVQVHGMLNSKYDVRVLQFDKKLEKPTSKRVVVLCPTVSLFAANRDILDQCKDATVIVFDTAVKLEYIRPMEILDVETKKSSYIYRFRELNSGIVRRAMERKTEVKVKTRPLKLIGRLLGQTHDSFIAKIMNFLYRIPNSEGREETKLMILSHLSENMVKELADKLEQKYKRNELIKGFIEMLRKGEADNFAKGLGEVTVALRGKRALRKEDAEAKLKATNYKKIAKQYGVSRFDLQYSAKYLARWLTTLQDKEHASTKT